MRSLNNSRRVKNAFKILFTVHCAKNANLQFMKTSKQKRSYESSLRYEWVHYHRHQEQMQSWMPLHILFFCIIQTARNIKLLLMNHSFSWQHRMQLKWLSSKSALDCRGISRVKWQLTRRRSRPHQRQRWWQSLVSKTMRVNWVGDYFGKFVTKQRRGELTKLKVPHARLSAQNFAH